MVCMVSMLISFLVKSGMCIKYPHSNKMHPRPPVNDSSWHDATYPNCTNFTATYTGLSSDTLAGNIYGLYSFLVMAALRSRCGRYIFCHVVSSFYLFFPRLISAVGDWMSTYFHTWCGLTANLERCEDPSVCE